LGSNEKAKGNGSAGDAGIDYQACAQRQLRRSDQRKDSSRGLAFQQRKRFMQIVYQECGEKNEAAGWRLNGWKIQYSKGDLCHGNGTESDENIFENEKG
jgi:hypothetical protein